MSPAHRAFYHLFILTLPFGVVSLSCREVAAPRAKALIQFPWFTLVYLAKGLFPA